MDRPEAAICKLIAALPASGYELGILCELGMDRLESIPASHVLRMLPYLKYRNANGANIFLRPTGESAYTLLDDLTPVSLRRLYVEGYDPAAAIETSPANFQAWVRHHEPLPKELGTLAAKTLAAQFCADPGAADWRRFGRAPGFTNRKPRHRSAGGLFPFARLGSHSGQPFPLAAAFRARLLALHADAERKRTAVRLSHAHWPVRFALPVTLSRFRNCPRYAGRPAAADMAFSIAACAQGWPQADIAAALTRDYLSRDTNAHRQAAYIRRTLAKAVRWAA